uniref:MBL fold metallo-hydrolase n=2 Tax=Haloterrigena alkaliphila TaxID=2816475 RepID=A0A8A2VT07_9EURY
MTAFEVADGVYGIDVEMFDSGVASVYLFDDDDDPTLVDAGIATTAQKIMDGIEACGLSPSELSNLVLSHIHVDHTGAASALVDAVPDLNVYIHESTAPHLVDPSGLVESSKRAMGDHFELIGEQGSVPEENVVGIGDGGTTIDLGSNSLELIYAPGHSPDHFAVWNPERELLFAAECLGLYLKEADQLLPPATLPNFDVDGVAKAIEKLETLDPDRIVFPHFGEWPHDSDEAFETAETELHRYDEWILERYRDTESRDRTKEAVARELLDLSPPYDPVVESFFSTLLTDGYLKYHDII